MSGSGARHSSLRRFRPIEDDLARLTRLHQLDAFDDSRVGEVMCDQSGEIILDWAEAA